MLTISTLSAAVAFSVINNRRQAEASEHTAGGRNVPIERSGGGV